MLQRIHQFRARLIPVRRISLSALDHDLLQPRRQSRIPLPDRVHLIRGKTGVMSCEQMIHGSSQRIDIRPAICLTVSAVLFRSRIPLGSQTGSVLNACFLEFSRRSEIYDLYLPVGLEHYIGRLQVTVYNGRLP